MTDTIADVRRRLHEALDALDQRDTVVTRLRHDLDAAGRRLAEEVARRRSAEARVVELEEQAARGPVGPAEGQGGRAAIEALVGHAASDLSEALATVARVLWHRLPEPLRARVWALRRRLGRS